jgi:hypothetical protein
MDDLDDDIIDLSSIKVVKTKQKNSEKITDTSFMDRINPFTIPNFNIPFENVFDDAQKNNNNKAIVPISKEKTNDDSIERRRLILMLEFYVLEFPDKLSAFKKTDFNNLDEKQLKELKSEFDFIIGAKCNVKSTQYLVLQGVYLIETVSKSFIGLNVNGLTNSVNDNEFMDDVKHLALKYMSLVKTEPEHRIAYKILSNMLLLHQINSASIGNVDLKTKTDELSKLNKKYDGILN